MEALILPVCIALILLGYFGSRLCQKLSDIYSEKNEEESYFKNELLKSVKDLKSREDEQSFQENDIDRILLANQELIEKQKVQKAIQEELGIRA